MSLSQITYSDKSIEDERPANRQARSRTAFRPQATILKIDQSGSHRAKRVSVMPRQPNPIRQGGRGVAPGRYATSGGEALVVMVQTTDLGEGDDPARAMRLDRTFVRTILVEAKVSPGSVIVVDVGRQYASQMSFVEDNDVIEALASDRADDALSIRILPWRTRCGDDLVDPHGFDAIAES